MRSHLRTPISNWTIKKKHTPEIYNSTFTCRKTLYFHISQLCCVSMPFRCCCLMCVCVCAAYFAPYIIFHSMVWPFLHISAKRSFSFRSMLMSVASVCEWLGVVSITQMIPFISFSLLFFPSLAFVSRPRRERLHCRIFESYFTIIFLWSENHNFYCLHLCLGRCCFRACTYARNRRVICFEIEAFLFFLLSVLNRIIFGLYTIRMRFFSFLLAFLLIRSLTMKNGYFLRLSYGQCCFLSFTLSCAIRFVLNGAYVVLYASQFTWVLDTSCDLWIKLWFDMLSIIGCSV